MIRLAVGYTPLHLKFTVNSQSAPLGLLWTRSLLRFALSYAVRNSLLFPMGWGPPTCTFPVYSFIPRAFAHCLHRAFPVRPLMQFQVRFPMHFLTLKQLHCKQLCVFPYGSRWVYFFVPRTFTAGFFVGLLIRYTLLSLSGTLRSPCVAFPVCSAISNPVHSPLGYWTFSMLSPFPRHLVRYNSTCIPSYLGRREWDRTG